MISNLKRTQQSTGLRLTNDVPLFEFVGACFALNRFGLSGPPL